MELKLFTITKNEFNRLALCHYCSYDYLGDEVYQFYFYDIFNNLIAIHIYKLVC